MRPLLLTLFAAAALTSCGDADSPTVPDPLPAESADAAGTSDASAPAPDAPDASAAASGTMTNEQCRTVVGPKVTQEPMRLIAEQTFATTSPMHGDGCFIAAYDPVSLDESERAQALGADPGTPYPYDYTVTDATGSTTTTLEAQVGSEPDHHLRLIAVGFSDLNGDGTQDVVLVHDDCRPALAWAAFADGWVQMPSLDGDAGLPACTVAEATAAFRDQASEATSP